MEKQLIKSQYAQINNDISDPFYILYKPDETFKYIFIMNIEHVIF